MDNLLFFQLQALVEGKVFQSVDEDICGIVVNRRDWVRWGYRINIWTYRAERIETNRHIG